MTTSILLLAFLFSSSHALHLSCPIEENIAPKCICKDLGNGPMMNCYKIMSPQELMVPLKEAEGHDMFSLALHDCVLNYIPNNIFKGTHFKKIRLVGTHLMSLAEGDDAFEGLENTLEEFRVMEAHYATQWTWSHLQNLHKLQLFDVDWVSLGSIDEPFPALETLTALGITRADISYIVENAFSKLENLRMLILKDNEISELSRNMFPNPAENLIFLDLSNNKLDTLPSGIFSDMPALKDLNLANNRFTTLNKDVFFEVMSNIQTLSLKGNNLRCDCRMSWIVNVEVPLELDAECSQPEQLKGVSLKHVRMKDLWC